MLVILVKNVLIVSKSQQSIAPLSGLLQERGYMDIEAVFSVQKAECLAESHPFDLVIINTPVMDGTGIELSFYMADNTRAGVLLLIREDAIETRREKIENHGIFIIPKPISRSYFCQAIKMWEVSKRRLTRLERENMELKNKVEEIKIIHRAKCVLMQCLSMSESQAHSYLEKQAMDMRQSKIRVAEQVLNTYEN